jgi:hypothetical protein
LPCTAPSPQRNSENTGIGIPSTTSSSAYAAAKNLYAWEFRRARRFGSLIPYEHPQRAVVWVKLFD